MAPGETRTEWLHIRNDRGHSHPSAVWQGSTAIAALVRQARGRISVMAGGGVRPKNVDSLIRLTGASEVHSACSRCASLSAMLYGSTQATICFAALAETKYEEQGVLLIKFFPEPCLTPVFCSSKQSASLLPQ